MIGGAASPRCGQMERMKYVLPFVMCLGCRGGSATPPPDGAKPDPDGMAGGDAVDPGVPCPNPGDPAGTVTVIGGASVVFHDAHGGVLSRADSSPATGAIPPCGAVTIAIDRGRFTITQLQPGETVSFVLPDGPAEGAHRTLAIDFPLVAGATTYTFSAGRRSDSLFGSCLGSQSATSPATLDLDERCVASDGTTAVSALARDANSAVLGYASVERVAVPAGSASIATIAAWHTETSATPVTLASFPDPTWHGQLGGNLVAGELALSGPSQITSALPGTMTLPSIGDGVLVTATLEHPQGHEHGIDLAQRVVATPLAAPLAFDGAADFAPHVATYTRDDRDPARPLIAWTTTRPTTGEHALVTIADYEQEQWFLIAPPDQPGAVRYPDLPADLRPQSPPQTGPQALAVMVVDASLFTSYADARRQPLALWYPTAFLPREQITSFTFRFSASGDFDQP